MRILQTSRKTISLLCSLVFVLRGMADAQCGECANIPAESIDFCYTDKLYPGLCASFVSKAGYFYFENKLAKVPSPAKFDFPQEEARQKSWLISMGKGKKPVLKSDELFFLEDAFAYYRCTVAIDSWDQDELNKHWTLRASGLNYRVIKMGNGKIPESGKKVTVHYTGWLPDGKKFDSSLDRKQSFSFVLGQRKVILGWEEGIGLFPVGTTVLLRIPPDLGYGDRGNPPAIPPKSFLYFQVQILSAE